MSFALVLMTFLAAAPAGPRPLPPPRDGGVLVPGQAPAAATMKATEAVEYALLADEGQLIRLVLDVDQSALRAELRAPDGSVVLALETHDDIPPLVISSVASASGTWHLVLRLAPEDSGATVRTRLEPPHLPDARERTRLEGERLFNEAKGLGPTSLGWDQENLRKGTAKAMEATAMFRRAGDESQEAWTYWVAAAFRYRVGEVRPALEDLKKTLAIFERLGDEGGVLQALHLLGTVEASASDYAAAIEHASRGLALAKKSGDPYVVAELQHAIGFAYGTMRETDLAIEHYSEAIAGWRTTSAPFNLANSLDLRGLERSFIGDHAGARRDHQEAQAIWKQLDDRRGRATSLIFVGTDLQLQGRLAEAVSTLRESLAISTKDALTKEEAAAGIALADVLATQGQAAEAKSLAARVLDIDRAAGVLDGVAGAEAMMARALLLEGHLDEARALAQEAVDLTETLRLSSVGTGLGGGYTAAIRRRYETLVDALARLEAREPGRRHAGQALAVSEQAHARGMLQLLSEARTDLRQGVDAELLEQEREAAAALAAASERQARQAAGGTTTPAERTATGQQLQAATRALDEAQARIRAGSPGYAEVVQGGTLDLAGIQRELGSDALVLEYLLGRDRSYLWAVGRGGVTIHQLERREKLEQAARALHRCWAERCPAGQERRLAAEASGLLLGPVKDLLRGERLVIVADGALHYLPFAALPIPGGAQRLVVAHEVVSLPSISTLAALRRQGAGRDPAPLSVAVLADPVFEARDARVTGRRLLVASAASSASGDSLRRSSRDLGLESLVRLQATRREAEWIAALAPSGQSLVATDFRATRELAIGGELARYRIVHFATHGLLDNRNPGLSGLVLSLVDETATPRNGFLRTSDVFGLKLNADLVVLSACQTALGKELRGEGLVGLARGFMYAGATRVLASLWMVPDGATAELMRRFYEAHLRRGLPPAAALREAQRAMAAEPRWSSPYNWAGFTLQGLWD
jgi:CHAT domain-containing protein